MQTSRFLVAVLVIVASTAASANGLPIQGETAFTTGLSGAGFRTFVKTIATPGSEGTNLKIVAPVIALHELIDNKLVLGVGLPFVLASDVTGTRFGEPAYGLGGLNLFGKVNIFQADAKGETLRVAGKLGLALPTDVSSFFGETGVLRPKIGGPGAPSVSTTIIVTKLIGRFGVNGDVGLTDVGLTVQPETQGINPGDIFRYNASIAYRVWPFVFKTYPDHQVNLLMEANGSVVSRLRTSGELIDDSGGHTLFLSPGIQYMYGQFLIEASLQIAAPYVTTGTDITTLPVTTALVGIRWLVF